MPETRAKEEADVAPCSAERGPLSLSTPKSASSVLEGYLNMNRAEGREREWAILQPSSNSSLDSE